MTRIAIVAAAFPPSQAGGVASAHHHLGQLLMQAGCDVRFFSFIDSGPETPGIDRRDSPLWLRHALRKAAKIFFRLADPSGAAYQTADILETFPGAWQLRRAIRAFAPDHLILPDHGSPGLAIGAMPKNCHITLVAHHNPMRFVGDPLLNPHSMRDAKAAVAIENLALRHVDRVVAPCLYMAESFRTTYSFSGPVEVIPNLVSPEELDCIPASDPRPSMGLPPEAPVIYIPSAGSRFKGSVLNAGLIGDIAARLPKPLGFYLSGRIAPDLLEVLRIAARGAPFLAPGQLSAAENIAIVKTCSLVASPTLIENFSMALLEAQLLGLPAASFDVGGNNELIEQGITGLLVPRGDIEGLAQAVQDILAPTCWTNFRQAARASALRRFDPQKWIPRWIA